MQEYVARGHKINMDNETGISHFGETLAINYYGFKDLGNGKWKLE